MFMQIQKHLRALSILVYHIIFIIILWLCWPYIDGLYDKFIYMLVLDLSLLFFLASCFIILFSQRFPHIIWLPIIMCAITPITTLYKFYSFANLVAYYIPTALISCFIISLLNARNISNKTIIYIGIILSLIIMCEPYILLPLPE